jgi:hypothetical protein
MKGARAQSAGDRRTPAQALHDLWARYWAWSDRNYDWLDRRMTWLAVHNPFWRRFLSFFWMPFAWHSGVRLVRRQGDTLHVLLPCRRPNRNWYGDMAGAALLGNAELAAGMILFEKCGADCIIVCRRMSFEFRANCTGRAIYVARPVTDIDDRVAGGRPFECTIDLGVFQCEKGTDRPGRKKVGSCEMTFSVTQKSFLPRRRRPWMPV